MISAESVYISVCFGHELVLLQSDGTAQSVFRNVFTDATGFAVDSRACILLLVRKCWNTAEEDDWAVRFVVIHSDRTTWTLKLLQVRDGCLTVRFTRVVEVALKN